MTESRDDLEPILTELTERVVAGDEVDPFDLIAEHPERAEEIRRELPRIVRLIEALAPERPGRKTAPDDRAPVGWREIQLLQAGGQGRVLLVEEISTGKRAAFKLLDRSDEGALREALAYDRLRETGDPALVRVHRVYANGILMEYLPGEELWDFVDPAARPGDTAIQELAASLGEKGDPYRRLAEAFVGPALGLHRIHRRGILHRDLKPQNVKVEERRGLVLFDLGLARVEGLQTISDPDAVLGTIPFLAPEALPGSDQSYSERTDVYGLGATLYTLLTNRPPHEGEDYFACLEAAKEKTPQPVRSYNPDVPAGLASIVEKAMARRPGDRYDSALEMAQDLERFANEQVPWAEIGLEALAKRRRKRRRVVAAVLVMALVGGLATWRLVRAIEDAARVSELESTLVAAEALLREYRAPESLARVQRVARAVPPVGFDEVLACDRCEARALRAMGRFEEAVTLWGRRLQHAEALEERRRLLEELADTLHEDARYEGVVRVVHRIPAPLSEETHEILVDSLLRLGHEDEARSLMAARGDAEALEVLDRFGRKRTVPLPGVISVAAIPLPDGSTALLAGREDGRVFRLRPGEEQDRQVEPIPWELRPFGRARVSYAGRPGEVIVAGARPGDAARGYAALARVGEAKPLREWPDVGGHVELVRVDVDADGRPDDIFFFRTVARGLYVETDGRRWSTEELGALAGLADSNTDVVALLPLADPEGGPPLLLIGTAAWDYDHGFRVHAYRWTEAGGFVQLGQTVLGEVRALFLADLDRDGSGEAYVSFVSMAHAEYRYVFPEFDVPGVYRLKLPVLETTPVRAWRQPGYMDGAGNLRKHGPYPVAPTGHPVELTNPRDALVYLKGSTYGGEADIRAQLLWRGTDRMRHITLPVALSHYQSLTCGDVLTASAGAELAIATTDAVAILSRRQVPEVPVASWRQLPLLRGSRGGTEGSLADDLFQAGYLEAAARLYAERARDAAPRREAHEEWRRSIRAWLEARRADAAVEALDGYRTTCRVSRGELAYWRGRLAESSVGLSDATYLYGHAASALPIGDELKRDASERLARLAAAIEDADVSITSFGLEAASASLPPPWSVSDMRLCEFVPAVGLRLVLHDAGRSQVAMPFALGQGDVRARLVLTVDRQDWGGQVDLGVFRPRAEPAHGSDGAFVALMRGDPGQRTLRTGYAIGAPYSANLLLTEANSYDFRWGIPHEFEFTYASHSRALRVVCRNAITGAVVGRAHLELPATLPSGDYLFGVRCGYWDVAYDARTDLVLHEAELEVFGGTIPREALAPETPTAPVVHHLHEAWHAWAAGKPDAMREHWRQARAAGPDLAPLLVGPFARPVSAFLEDLPPDLVDSGLAADLVRIASSTGSKRHPELIVHLLGERADRTEEESHVLRQALIQLGRTAEAYEMGEVEPDEDLPDLGDRTKALLRARTSIRKLLPRRALARVDEVLRSRPRIRERIEAHIYTARARLMLRDEAGAREALDALRSIEAFDAEELKDYPDLRRFLRSERDGAGK